MKRVTLLAAVGAMAIILSMNGKPAFAQGQVFWEENGVVICEDYFGGGTDPLAVTEDGVGGATIAWADTRDGVYAQRVDSNGSCLWTLNGVEVYGPSLFPSDIRSVSDGRGGAIIAWEHFYGGEQGIYAARVDSNGIVWWAIPVCPSDSIQEYPSIVSDGAGGAIIAWVDRRNGSSDIYAQRIDATGVPRWTSSGISICSLGSTSLWPQVANNGSNGATITWSDYRSGNWDIYGQRVDSSGVTQWSTNGVPICTADSAQNIPLIVSSGDGAIIVWTDKRSGDWDIYGQRVDIDGVTQWSMTGIPICAESGRQGGYGTGTKLTIEEDGCGGAIVCWRDWRSGRHDVYAQRVDTSGVLAWPDSGLFICSAADTSLESINFAIEGDGRRGIIVSWTDIRAGNWDMYCQRVDSSGVLKWDPGGLAVCTTPEEQFWGPVISTDREGGAIIAWGDTRLGVSVYAQRVGDLVGVEEKAKSQFSMTNDQLFENFPDPFRQRTEIRYQISVLSHINLGIYGVAGGLIKVLVDGEKEAGEHRAVWDGRNNKGEMVATGIYFCRLRSAGFVKTKKMIFIE